MSIRGYRCCYPTCPKDADFVIIDEGDNDPYTRETHACDRCLGAMIGHCSVGTMNGQDKWAIYPIDDIYP